MKKLVKDLPGFPRIEPYVNKTLTSLTEAYQAGKVEGRYQTLEEIGNLQQELEPLDEDELYEFTIKFWEALARKTGYTEKPPITFLTNLCELIAQRFGTSAVGTGKQDNELYIASKAMVDLINKHHAYEENRTKKLQEAANLAREGKQEEANKIVRAMDNQPIVFDFSQVNNDLIKAVKNYKLSPSLGTKEVDERFTIAKDGITYCPTNGTGYEKDKDWFISWDELAKIFIEERNR